MARIIDALYPPRTMKYRDVQRLAREQGFELDRCCGDHEQWEHPDGRRVTLLAGSGEYHTGTLRAVLAVLMLAAWAVVAFVGAVPIVTLLRAAAP